MEPVSFPGTLDSLAPLRAYVKAAALDAALDRPATHRLCLAVDEIAANAIGHGKLGDNCVGCLQVWADQDANGLRITLADNGEAFDPSRTPLPESLDWPLEDRPSGGLGIYLVLRCVDEFQHERVGDWNYNRFTMKYRGKR
jgi:anti-sigma regulatory factor (Ser/Thr protein kinase)